ncbi:MAG: BadF/BadG/BcrA/BcrD ATPase family protein [Eubacteriales bacterium]|nr:BadF/BadG/BcrA/BcrD ATPase family protein [Eubacteriales bacterium]
MPITKCEPFFIGLDGGGTKTDAVLFTSEGTVLRRVRGRATNPISCAEHAPAHLRACLEALLKDFGGLCRPLSGVFAGIAGGGLTDHQRSIHEQLITLMPNAASVENGSDALNELTALLGLQDGVVAIAGTGSCVYARREGKMIRAGGWGYLFEDACSAFELGRQALLLAMEETDGRGAATAVTPYIEKELGGTVADKLSELYASGMARIAGLAPCLTRAAVEGDEAAQRVVNLQARLLVRCICAAGDKLDRGTPYSVVLTGSLWQAVPMLREIVQSELGSSHPLLSSALPPVYGAARHAVMQCGQQADEVFRSTFSKTLKGTEAICI